MGAGVTPGSGPCSAAAPSPHPDTAPQGDSAVPAASAPHRRRIKAAFVWSLKF